MPRTQTQRFVALGLRHRVAPTVLPLQAHPALLSGIARRIVKLLIELLLQCFTPVAGGAVSIVLRLALIGQAGGRRGHLLAGAERHHHY
ncbi:hypothetical protein RSA31_00540 [Pantoea dispersa]|nr:hypothetical protein NS215_06840 [Pantoea dispersa]KTS89494.1 hypothetical protein RSA31_00540 [Pantoea dispersa]